MSAPKKKPGAVPPPDWPTVADYNAARAADGPPCPPHDWKKKPDGSHKCKTCGQDIPAGDHASGLQHLPYPSTFTGSK